MLSRFVMRRRDEKKRLTGDGEEKKSSIAAGRDGKKK